MMIRSLRQLLKAYWKEQTKAQIKQKKSRLLIYDEHLKRFVSADELLIPNDSYKVNKIGGHIAKRKSKDLIYDLLLKKFVNTKLDILSPGGIDDRPFCKINSLQQKYENISTSNKDFFWGKKYSGKKQRVPALPPVDRKTPIKEEETTNTGWAGQRTIDPETDPRPELRTSGDCPIGPGKRPDKKKSHGKKNVGKRLIVCTKENHKISEKDPSINITKRMQSKSKISDPSTICKPKDQAPHSKEYVVKSQEYLKQEDSLIKSSPALSKKHHNDLSGLTNPRMHKTGATKVSDPSTICKPKDQIPHSKVSVVKSQECINKEDDVIKSRVALSEKHHNGLSVGPTNPCLCKTGATKVSNPSTIRKPKDQVPHSKVSVVKSQECINKTEDNEMKSRVGLSEKKLNNLSVSPTNPSLRKTGATQISDPSTICKPKYQVPHSKVSVVKSQECINTEDNVIKSRVSPSEKHHYDLNVRPTNPCICKTGEAVTASKLQCDKSKEKTIDHIKCNTSFKSTCVQTQNPSTKGECINNRRRETPEIELNCEESENIKDQSDKTIGRVMPSNNCASRKQETDFKTNYNRGLVNENNKICENITTEHPKSKINQPLSSLNLQKQTLLKDLPNNIKRCDSNGNYKKDVNKSVTMCKNISPEIGLNCGNWIGKTGQTKDQTGQTSDRVMPKYESKNICVRSKKDAGLKFSYNNDASGCNKIDRSIRTEYQNIKTTQPLPRTNELKQTHLKDLQTNIVAKCDSTYNKDVNKNTTFCKGITEPGSELCNNSNGINNKKPLSNPSVNQQALSKNLPSIISTKCGLNEKMNKGENNSNCSSVESKCDQDRKVNQLVVDKKECKPFKKEESKQVLRCISDSNVNFNVSCNTKEEIVKQRLRSSELTKKVNRSETNASSGQTCTSLAKLDTVGSSPLSISSKCQSINVKTEPLGPSCLRQPEISNNDTRSCKKVDQFSNTPSKKRLEFGICPQETTKEASPKPSLSIKNSTNCGIDSKVSEKLEAITQDKCLNEISHKNDLSKLKDERYVGFKIKKSHTELSDNMSDFKNKEVESKPKELQSEKSKRSSNEGKIKKNKSKKSKGGKKLKKGLSKDTKAGLKKDYISKENTKEVRCKQEHNDTQIENCKPNMSQEKHVVKRNKNKLQTINKLSSNMSSRHSKAILKKCKNVINLKSNTKGNTNNSYMILPHVQTQGKEGLSENKQLENKSKLKLNKQDQLLKNNRTSCKNKPDTKKKHDTVSENQPSQTRLKQTQSTITANICRKRCPSKSKSEVLLKPINKKVINKSVIDHNSRFKDKGISNNTVLRIKPTRKCNFCIDKHVSSQSINPQNKEITLSNVSSNFKATKTVKKNVLNSKATTLAPQKLKKQEIRHFSALNVHDNELKTLNPCCLSHSRGNPQKGTSPTSKGNPQKLSKFDTSKSEIGSYKNYTSSTHTVEENKVLINLPNQANYYKQGCKLGHERNSKKTPFLASLAASRKSVSLSLNNGMIKSSCNTIKIKEQNIVPIKAYSESHDLLDNCENHLLNSNLNTLHPIFTKRILGSPTKKKKEGSKSVIVKPLLTNKIVRKNKSSTLLESGNYENPVFTNKITRKNKSSTLLDSGKDVPTAVERKSLRNLCKENPSLSKNYKVNPNKVVTKTPMNLGLNHKGIVNNINTNKAVTKTPKNVWPNHKGGIVNNINKNKAENKTPKNVLPNHKGGIKNNINRPISIESNNIKNKENEVGTDNSNNKQSKSVLLDRVKYISEDKISPDKVQLKPNKPQEKPNGVQDLIHIKHIGTDRQLVYLASKNPLIKKNEIEKDILPFVTKVHSDKISQASTIPPKSNTTKTILQKFTNDNGLLKYNVPLKATYLKDDHLQQEISKDSNNTKMSDPHCVKKFIKNTEHKISQSSIIKSNTFTVSTKRNSNNVPKMKTFTVKASKIQKKDVPKTKTFTIIPSKSYKKRVMCTVKRP